MERLLLVCLSVILLTTRVEQAAARAPMVRLPAGQPSRTDDSPPSGGRVTRSVLDTGGGLCLTPTCVEVASQVLEYRNVTADPCQDFHAYACGSWQRENDILGLLEPGESYSINSDYLDNLIDRKIRELLSSSKESSSTGIEWAKYLFHHCVYELYGSQEDLDEAADHVLQTVLGGLRTADQWDREPQQLTDTLLQLGQLVGGELLDANLMQDLTGRPRAAFSIDLPLYDAGASMSHHAKRVPRAKRRRQPERRRVSQPLNLSPPPSTDWVEYDAVGRDNIDDAVDRGSLDVDYDADYDAVGRSIFNAVAQADVDVDNGEAAEDESDDGAGSGDGRSDGDDPSGQPQTSSELYAEQRDEMYGEKLDEMREFFKSVLVDKGLFPAADAEGELRQMMKFLEDLHSIMPAPRDRIVAEARLHLLQEGVTVDQLQTEYPYVDWTRLLSGLLGITVRGEDTAYVYFPQYLTQLGDLLRIHDPRIVHNAILLKFRVEFLADAVSELVDAGSSLSAGEDYCASFTKDVFPTAVSAMFVRDAGKQKVDALRAKVSSMIEGIREELLRLIQEKAALRPDPLLDLANRKIQNTRFLLMAPDELWEDRYVDVNTPPADRLWRQLRWHTLVRSGRYLLLDLLRGLRRSYLIQVKSQLREIMSPDPARWPSDVQPTMANAFHLSSANAVAVCLALMTEPYFYENVPEYVQYAVLGTTLAHELLHGIDNTGFYFNENGAMVRLGSDLEQRIADKFSCVKNEYVQPFTRMIEVDDMTVLLQTDGDMALTENTADFSSLALTWSAYSNRHQGRQQEAKLPGVNLTDQQAFFVSFAQVYCANIEPWSYVTITGSTSHEPNPERVNGMVRQTPEFAAAFSCPAGTPMNPSTRCDPVW